MQGMTDAEVAALKATEDVEPSREAGLSMARREAFGLDDGNRALVVRSCREALANPRVNKYAKAYAEGVLDALAPLGLYA